MKNSWPRFASALMAVALLAACNPNRDTEGRRAKRAASARAQVSAQNEQITDLELELRRHSIKFVETQIQVEMETAAAHKRGGEPSARLKELNEQRQAAYDELNKLLKAKGRPAEPMPSAIPASPLPTAPAPSTACHCVASDPLCDCL